MDMLFVIVPFILLAETIWQVYINYPPTLSQLNLVDINTFLLWFMRFVSLIFILLSVYFISKIIDKNNRRYFWIFILLSPLISLVTLSYPIDSLRLLIITSGFYLLISRLKNTLMAVLTTAILIVVVNIFIFKDKPKILEDLSIKRAQAEITARINIEDIITPNIKIPLVIRRIGYNKYFFVFKNVSSSALRYFDFETLFFQEVHPMDQKAIPVFFWPEIFLFIGSLYLIINSDKKRLGIILSLFTLSFVYFITSSASIERRHLITIFPVALVLSAGIKNMLSSRNQPLKTITYVFIFLTFYGWATNYTDRFIRPDYWLDNRPIAYGFIFKTIKDVKPDFKTAFFPDTLYAFNVYCRYYKADCNKMQSKNFEITEINLDKDILYIGFTGNFAGKTNKDMEYEELVELLKSKNLKIIGSKQILNNIASGFGQELIVAQYLP